MNKKATVFFGETTFRGQKQKFGIKIDDRRRHFYCIGKTGMGKSNLMENMAIQDIQAGRGIAYVDPHGDGAEKLLDFIPASRINDVIFFNPADLDYPIAFNVMEKVDFRYRHLVAGGLMGVFKKVWPDVWSARMEYILNNSILALLEYPDATLLGVNRMLSDPEYRAKVVDKITDPIVKSFWVSEFAKYTARYEQEATAAIQNKIGQFISNPLIRNLIGQVKSTVNMRDIMDKEKIFIMDLSKGRIGEDNSRLLGALLITKLQLAAMSRVDIPEDSRKDFYLYVDEFQNFATESFANILSEARKYRLNIILGHQYISQMEDEIRDAVFGNVGTLAVFRIGAEDAEFLEREFSPNFTAEDLVNLPKYNVYLKLMIDGIAGNPFSAHILPPPVPLEKSSKEKIIKASRERYGVKKEIVEEKIFKWTGFSKEDMGGKENKNKKIEKPSEFKKNERRDEQPVLYDAICSDCNRDIKVVFVPEKGRAIYCKSCLQKRKVVAESNQQSRKLELDSQDRNEKIKDISFNAPKNRSSQRKINIRERPQKKEINLSELRQALEKSLEKKDDDKEQEDLSKDEKQEKVDKLKNIPQPFGGQKQIEEPDEVKELPAEEKPAGLLLEGAQTKKKINPGETVKF